MWTRCWGSLKSCAVGVSEWLARILFPTVSRYVSRLALPPMLYPEGVNWFECVQSFVTPSCT